MVHPEFAAQIRALELISRKLLAGQISGDYRTLFKGSGFEFDQLRDYQQGDDIRFIDWKSSARSGKMLVRQYLEDRNRTVLLVVDISASTYYGSGTVLKSTMIQQLAGIIAFLGLYNKDSVGLLLYNQTVEHFIPPKASRGHIMTIINQLFEHKDKNQASDSHANTCVNAALEFIMKQKLKKSVVFLFSDLLDVVDQKLLHIVNKYHDVRAIGFRDAYEYTFPHVGLLELRDSQTGVKQIVDTRNILLNAELKQWYINQDRLYKQAKIPLLMLQTDKPFLSKLALFLKQL